MAQPGTAHYITEAEYFALEAKSQSKHEYFAGEVFAMAGGTYNHSIITSNLSRHLGNLLTGRCAVASPDLRTKVEASGLMVYPDTTVICGKPHLLTDPPDTLLNPSLIAEVLSPSTEHYDRTFKFDHYKRIPSLRTYLVVSQVAPFVEQYLREGDFWRHDAASALTANLHLPALDVVLSLAEIYRDVEFDPAQGGLTLPFHG